MPDHLWRDLGIILAAKLVVLTIFYLLFFSPQHQPLLDQSALARWMLGNGATSTER